ncbi:MAG TPA: hypothetical protein VIK91_23080 [Nannocystis sp.]|jgi:hypothetical protein
MSKTDPSKAAQDNRANQLNPTHPAYHRSRGASEGEAADQAAHSKPALDNRANQLNPNNEAHQSSRGKGGNKGR